MDATRCRGNSCRWAEGRWAEGCKVDAVEADEISRDLGVITDVDPKVDGGSEHNKLELTHSSSSSFSSNGSKGDAEGSDGRGILNIVGIDISGSKGKLCKGSEKKAKMAMMEATN